MPESGQTGAYAASGVDIDAGNRAKALMRASVQSTRRPEVLADFGSFGGLFALKPLNMRDPVLVTSIDSVGTKLKLAFTLNRHDTVGLDIVAHCVNDILVCGARPLMFLDYLGLGGIDPEVTARIVAGVAAGCRAAGCALIGGETAQLPGLYAPGEYDLAGCVIGIAERGALVTGERIQDGDVVVGLPSVGLHTNGYSLARRVFEDADLTAPVAALDGRTLADVLLEPHRSYLTPVMRVLDDPTLVGAVTGMAHITGGGLLENIPRVMPSGLGVDLDATRWEISPIFRLIQQRGNVAWNEMARVFNLGVGYVVMVRVDQANAVLAAMSDVGARIVGQVVARPESGGGAESLGPVPGECVRVEGLPLGAVPPPGRSGAR